MSLRFRLFSAFALGAAILPSALEAQIGSSAIGAVAPRFDLAGWRLPADGLTVSSWAEIDLDRDGTNELFVGAHDRPAKLWRREQGVFVEDLGALPGALSDVTQAIAADFDGDGYTDLFLGRAPSGPFAWPGDDPSAGWDRLWMNRAAGGRRVLVEATWTTGYGIFDLLVLPSLANLPHFPLLPRFPVIDFDELRYTHGVLARDFDGDGDLDLALAHGGWDPLARRGVEIEPLVLPMPCAIYFNVGDTNGDGFPNFVDAEVLLHDDPDTPAIEPAGVLASSITASDFDGDGDLDLFLGVMASDTGLHFGNVASGAPNRYYEALRDTAGRPRWVNRSLRVLGPQSPREETRAVLALPLDASGEVQLLTFSFQDARSIGGAWHRHRVLRFDRTLRRFVERLGAFAGATTSADELCASVTPVDLDGDGDLDFVCGGPRVVQIENRGGVFTRVASSVLEARYEATVAWPLGADRDGDGLADRGRAPEALLVGALRDQPRWLVSIRGSLEDETAPGLPIDLGLTLETIAVDLTGDARAEVVLLKENGELRLWRALDDARFRDETGTLPSAPQRWIAVEAWDVDGQNGPDLVLVDARGAHAWWSNDGSGRFSAQAAPLDSSGRELRAARILGADFDGDGLRDVIVLREALDGGPIAPLRWNGTGTSFVDALAAMPSGAASRSSLGAALDADGDGRSEVLLWNQHGFPELWRALPGGVHQRIAGSLPATAIGVGSIASTDLNADGVPDLYLAAGDAHLAQDRLWLSESSAGAFPRWRDANAHPLLTVGASTGTRRASARFADLDGDGLLDFAVGREGGSSCFHRQLPRGGWSAPEPFPDLRAWNGRGWAAFDQNGDGLLELWIFGATQTRSYRHRSTR
ncbi:MAG: VCBS repeat-containing protein [Planctomycetes bacterium]|nr:VCBS repeat-containing protein [Planctomycetota bacterium]